VIRADALLRKAAAVGLLLLFLVPVPAAGIWALAVYRNAEIDRQEKLERFDRLRAIVAFGETAPKKTAAPDVARYLLGAGPPAVLTAGLQARLRDIAAHQGVDVLQASDLKAREADGLTALGVTVEMTGPAQGIHAVLEQLELSVPWLFLGRLQIRSGYPEGGNPETEPPLAVELDTWGLAAPPQGSESTR
jgi:Type II secretion system (T2SS), protein M subtype b